MWVTVRAWSPRCAVGRQPLPTANRNLRATRRRRPDVGFAHDRHPRHVPRLRRREGRRRRASSAASASSPRRTCRPARSRSGSTGRASTTRTAWPRRADGKVARISPLIPGIDLAGEVVASPTIRRSRSVTAVLAHGYDLGVARHGGFAEYQRVPAGWVVPLPPRSVARATRWRSGRPGSPRRCPSPRSRSAACDPATGRSS